MEDQQTQNKNFWREKLKPYIQHHWQGFLISVLALLTLLSQAEISIYLFFYFSGFVYISLFIENKWSWLRKLLIAPIISVATLIILCGIVDVINIPIGLWCIYAVWGGALIIALIKPLRIDIHFNIKSSDGTAFVDIGLAIIFIVALLARIIPVIDEYAPILHDPVAHAAWAKDIIETGHVNRFYSPGLHFTIGMTTLTTEADYGRATLMITQYFNALACLGGGIFIYILSKKKYWALLTSAFFAVGGQPAAFYTGAGKNALVFTFVFMFLTWTAIHIDIKRIYKIVLCNMLLLATILSHSPLAFICVLGIFVFFLLSKKKKAFLLLFIAAIVLGIIWGGLKLHYQINFIESVEEKGHQQDETTISDILTAENIKNEIIDSIFEIEETLSLQKINYSHILMLIGLVLLLLLGYQDRRLWFFPAFHFLYYLLIKIGLFFHPINPLGIVISTQEIAYFIFSHMIVPFSITLLLFRFPKRIKISTLAFQIYRFLISALIFIGLIIGAAEIIESYNYYQSNFAPVHMSDIEAFEWMTDNLPEDTKILVNARIHEKKYSSVVFAGDSGVWIPIYTEFQISSPFEDTFNYDTYNNTKLYLELAEDPSNCEIRNELIDNGFLFYFQGSRAVHSEQIVVTDETFETVFTNGTVTIYQIIPCSP